MATGRPDHGLVVLSVLLAGFQMKSFLGATPTGGDGRAPTGSPRVGPTPLELSRSPGDAVRPRPAESISLRIPPPGLKPVRPPANPKSHKAAESPAGSGPALLNFPPFQRTFLEACPGQAPTHPARPGEGAGSRRRQPVGPHPGFPGPPAPGLLPLSPLPMGSVPTHLPMPPPICPFFSLDPLFPSSLPPPSLSLEWP